MTGWVSFTICASEGSNGCEGGLDILPGNLKKEDSLLILLILAQQMFLSSLEILFLEEN